MTTVETLTAHVHVITVDKRQLSLTMARQLDRFPINSQSITNFRAWGRIRTGAKLRLSPGYGPEIAAGIELIGTHAETGQLMTLICHETHIENHLEQRFILEQMELPLIILGGMR